MVERERHTHSHTQRRKKRKRRETNTRLMPSLFTIVHKKEASIITMRLSFEMGIPSAIIAPCHDPSQKAIPDEKRRLYW